VESTEHFYSQTNLDPTSISRVVQNAILKVHYTI